MTQHHFCRQNQRTWVHFVQTSIFWCSTVGCFKASVLVRNICTWGNTNTTNLCSQGVRDVVTVQVAASDHIVFSRTQQDLLQESISNRVFHHDFTTGVRVGEFAPWAAIDQFCAEFFLSHFVAHITEQTFGELHDVTFVHQGNALTIVVDRVFHRGAHNTSGAFNRNRFDTDTRGGWEADFFHAHFVLQEVDDFLGVVGLSLPFDTGIDVFGVFTEDHHIGFRWVFQWRRHASEIAHRAHALIQVEFLTQCHVQRTDTAADWGGHWAFDRHGIFFQCVKCFFWQPFISTVDAGGFFTSIHFHPMNFLLATIGFRNSSINHIFHHRSDIDTNTIAFDERNNRIVRNGLTRDNFLAFLGDLDMRSCAHAYSILS